MTDEDRKVIGDDVRTAKMAGSTLRMTAADLPPIKGTAGDMEIRSTLGSNRISRVFFCIENGAMVLLHGIIKKTQKTPVQDLDLAQKRMKELRS